MNDPNLDLPGRLKIVGATDLERRFLSAAAREQPSPELRKRMATSIGLSTAVLGAIATDSALSVTAADSALGVTAADSALGTTVVSAKSAGIFLLTPWITAGALLITVAGVIVGSKVWKDIPSSSPPNPVEAISEKLSTAPSTAIPAVADRPGVATSGVDLREQITLIDNARAAITTGASHRALEILRHYQDKYPAGSFQPEAQALQVEGLAKLGRMAEARTLARKFVAKHAGSPLADRVARATGIARP